MNIHSIALLKDLLSSPRPIVGMSRRVGCIQSAEGVLVHSPTQHDDELRLLLQHHSPEVLLRVLEWHLRADERVEERSASHIARVDEVASSTAKQSINQ